jgi:hypothetical protein
MPKQKYTFGQIKRHLQEQPALHFRGLTKEDVGKGLTKFSNNFFEYNKTLDTYQGNSLHTPKGRRRSIGDIYCIFYYYFPKITLTSVYAIVLGQISKGIALSAICNATKMRVYRGVRKGYEQHYFNGEPIDEFGVDIKEFEDFESCPREIGSWGVGATSKNLKIIEL